MKPEESYWSVVETVWETISIYDGEKVFQSQYAQAPLIARHLFASHWCQSEVRNGGLRQFFTNRTGVLAPEAIEAFEAIGMPEISKILKKAVKLFGTPYPRAKTARAKLICGSNKAEFNKKLNELDDKFFSYLSFENGGYENAADSYAKAQR